MYNDGAKEITASSETSLEPWYVGRGVAAMILLHNEDICVCEFQLFYIKNTKRAHFKWAKILKQVLR